MTARLADGWCRFSCGVLTSGIRASCGPGLDCDDDADIQRVIHEVSGGISYPTLTKSNYSDWALLMKVKLKARALWDRSGGNDGALCALQCGATGYGVDHCKVGDKQVGLGHDHGHEGRSRPREEIDDTTAPSQVRSRHIP